MNTHGDHGTDGREGMGVSRVIRPKNYSGHRCDLPDAATLPLRTLGQCDNCGRWSFVALFEYAMGGYFGWTGVHWWHLRLRRNIAQSGPEVDRG